MLDYSYEIEIIGQLHLNQGDLHTSVAVKLLLVQWLPTAITVGVVARGSVMMHNLIMWGIVGPVS